MTPENKIMLDYWVQLFVQLEPYLDTEQRHALFSSVQRISPEIYGEFITLTQKDEWVP